MFSFSVCKAQLRLCIALKLGEQIFKTFSYVQNGVLTIFEQPYFVVCREWWEAGKDLLGDST